MISGDSFHLSPNSHVLNVCSPSGYNTGGQAVKNLMQVITKRITMQGVIVVHLDHKYHEEFYATIPKKLKNGEIRYTEEVTEGLDKVGEVILRVQKGDNKAKAVVKVADE
ncbi:hypothetical protein C0993_001301 [Termitomyces sp. T159_Od127]|nr:hypothetical protein C0993_001301 [Termitomyces sp. T159_Od127]